jgi:predicted TIM-barrel fold metal-dependent hydrolase
MAPAAAKAQPAAYAGTLVSAESYLAEPADLWQQALPAPWRARGPRVTRGAAGDQFEIDGVPPRPLGLPAALTQLSRIGISFGAASDAHAYGQPPRDQDGAARVAWQRKAGLAAEVLHPTLGLLITTSPDERLQQLCCRVYNDWLAAFCAADPKRLRGMALLPARAEMADIVAEIEHAAGLGLAGVVLPARHGVTPYNMPAWDAAWAALEAHGLVCAVHLGPEEGAALSPAGPGAGGILLSTGKYELNEFLQMIVWGGGVQRFPGLRFGLVGSGAGWLATQINLMDHWWHDHKGWMEPRLAHAPSHFWHQQGFATVQADTAGLATRDIIGVPNLLWGLGTDAATDALGSELNALPDGDAAAIASGNAARLFGIDV